MTKKNECASDRCCKEWYLRGESSCEYFTPASCGKFRCKYMTTYIDGKKATSGGVCCINEEAYALKKLEEI